jgi:hypothetical protein
MGLENRCKKESEVGSHEKETANLAQCPQNQGRNILQSEYQRKRPKV